MKPTTFVIVLSLFPFASSLVLAQAPPAPPSIQASAEAVVTVKPDQAQMDVGVVTQNANAQAAVQESSRRVDATISAIRNVLGEGGDVKTVGYAVRPDYRYAKEGGTPTISGYTVSNVLQVSVNDLTIVGRLIDAATASGANTIQQLRFSLRDEQLAQLQALREATSRARAKAQAIAAALGLKVIRVLRAEEQGAIMRPQPERAFAMAAVGGSAAVPTPVEAGTIEVHATVTITVEVGQ